MDRQIKFRGRDVITGNWAYGFYYPSKGHHIIRDEKDCECIVLYKTVGQFTELHDSEGEEIYEGDILEFTDKWEWYRGEWFAKFYFTSGDEKKELQKKYDALPMYRREVAMDKDGVNFSTYDLGEGRWKVVGNVYENVEMLTP